MELTWPYFISTSKKFEILHKLIKGTDYSRVIIFELIVKPENT